MIWDIEQLSECPEVFEADGLKSEAVKAIYFKGLDFKGSPTRVFAWIGFPENCENKKVPGVVLVHGGAGTAYAEWVRIWNRRGYAAIAVSTTGKNGIETETPEQSQLVPHRWAGPTEADKFRPNQVPSEDNWVYHAVAEVIFAHSLLRSYSQVEAEKIGIVGVSWGGFLTCIASSIDNRFKCAASAYGCGFIHIDSPTLEYDKDSEAGKKWIKSWDPSIYLPDNKIPFFWFTGTNDSAYSLGILERSYCLIKRDLALRISPDMNHGHVCGWNTQEQYSFFDSHLKGSYGLVKVHTPLLEGENLLIKYDSSKPVKKAELIFSTDICDRWQDREWNLLKIVIHTPGEINVKLPEKTLHAFVNITDHLDLTVSSRLIHKALPIN